MTNNSLFYDDSYMKIDSQSHRVIVAGIEIVLARIEFDLLIELMTNVGVVLKYDDLIKKIWGTEYCGARNYLHNYIYTLRRKIEPDPKNPGYIITIPKSGYRFNSHL